MSNLEYAIDGDGRLAPDAVQRNFEMLSAAGVGSGGRSIELRFDVSAISFPTGATRFSAVVPVPHGLGRVPAVVLAGIANNGANIYQKVDVVSWDATDFLLQCSNTDGSTFTTTAVSVGWVAIG